ncbi:PLP-dependent transferase [Hymenopellis radicata]|nr:PLP-dependent transferase [Hymenopellis radicata]
MFLDRLGKHEFILGSRAARHGGGNTPDIVRLEQRLAEFFNGSSALFFNSGMDANVGLWSTLPQPDDVILYDECVHASMHDGMRASKARNALYAFKHNSVDDLRKKLQEVMRTKSSVRNGRSSVFVLTDALYSMDGDFAPLEEICTAVEDILPEGSGYVFTDEAHSTGIVGEHGRGVTVHLGLQQRVLIRLHTFGKAFGCSGAVVICPSNIRHYLIYACRAFIFTTAAPRYNVLNVECVLDYMNSLEGRKLVAREQALITYARDGLSRHFRGVDSDIARIPVECASVAKYVSPVVPIFSTKAADLAECLTKHGFPMRHAVFPIVPLGTERIRLTIQACNTFAEIDDLVNIIGIWVKEEQARRVSVKRCQSKTIG